MTTSIAGIGPTLPDFDSVARNAVRLWLQARNIETGQLSTDFNAVSVHVYHDPDPVATYSETITGWEVIPPVGTPGNPHPSWPTSKYPDGANCSFEIPGSAFPVAGRYRVEAVFNGAASVIFGNVSSRTNQ